MKTISALTWESFERTHIVLGGDGKQGYQQLCKNNLIVSDWIHNKADLNVLLAKQRAAEAPAARQGKAKGVEPRGCLSFDPRECSLDSWQLGESVEDFVNRLPPLTTTTLTCPWIWVHNPWQDAHCHTAAVRVEEFTNRGRLLLDRSLHNRRNIQECGPKAFIAKSLIQEGKALQHKITELAVECGVVSGKVSDFLCKPWPYFTKDDSGMYRMYLILTCKLVDALPQSRASFKNLGTSSRRCHQ